MEFPIFLTFITALGTEAQQDQHEEGEYQGSRHYYKRLVQITV